MNKMKKKLKDNNYMYEHERKEGQRAISPPDHHKSLGMSSTSLQISLWDRWMCAQSLYREGRKVYPVLPRLLSCAR